MKLPEPVVWIDSSDLELMHKHGRGCIAWGNEQNNAKTPLFTEAQLRELLSKQEAVMQQAFDALYFSTPIGVRPCKQNADALEALKLALNKEE